MVLPEGRHSRGRSASNISSRKHNSNSVRDLVGVVEKGDIDRKLGNSTATPSTRDKTDVHGSNYVDIEHIPVRISSIDDSEGFHHRYSDDENELLLRARSKLGEMSIVGE